MNSKRASEHPETFGLLAASGTRISKFGVELLFPTPLDIFNPMKEASLRMELWIPRLRDEVFEFFTKARNLQAVTPPWLSFSVLTPDPIVMRKGTLLDYRRKRLLELFPAHTT